MKKQELFTTAQALASCACFKKGDFVHVKYCCTDNNGVDWYECWKTSEAKACYPAHHLTRLTL